MPHPRRRLAVPCALALIGTVPAPAFAADPGNDEQLMLEMVNRMRWDPAAELHTLVNIDPGPPATWRSPKSGDPDVAAALTYFRVDANALASQWAALAPRVAPLAWNGALHGAAAAHNAEMIRYDQQSHQLPGEPALGQRFVNAGYPFTAGAENVYAHAEGVFHAHAAFAIDWGSGPGGIQSPPGHRNHIMDPNLREAGIAVTRETSSATAVGPLVVTQDFGRRSGNAFLTGVAYDDGLVDRDSFYTPGEGLAGVTVQALAAGTNAVRGSTTTFASGGYTLQLAPGTYDVTLSGGALGGRTVTYRNVALAGDNVKVDTLSSFIAAPGATWNAVQNWSAGVPNGPGTTAILGRLIPGQAPGPRTVAVTAPVTVGRLVFDGANAVTVDGPAAITLAGGGTAPASITVRPAPGGATHTVAGPIGFAGEVVRDGTGALTLAGPQRHAAGARLVARQGRTDLATNAGAPAARPLTVAADGAATSIHFLASQDLARLDVTGGARVTLTPGGGRVIATGGLLLNGGTLDLTDNAMLVDYDGSSAGATPHDVRAAVVRGYDGGTWAGDGITSSSAAARRNAAVGYAESTDVFEFGSGVVHTFFGRAVDETTMLVRYTFEGDADLDGAVTFADFRRVRAALGSPGDWPDGDFDYDGRVTAWDYALLRRSFGSSLTGAGPSVTAAEWAVLDAFAAAVPEPSAAVLLACCGLGGLARRGRRGAGGRGLRP